jgi:hypothetical protein
MSEQSEMRQIIEDKLTGIHASIKAQENINKVQHDELIKQLESVQTKQDLTNSRLTTVEKETRAFRYLQKKPLLCIGILFGIAILANFVDLQEVINLLYKLLA